MFAAGPSSISSNSFLKLFFRSTFLLCFFFLHILHQNLFCFFFIRLLIWLCELSTNLIGRIFFRHFETSCFVCIVCRPSRYFFNLSFFANIFCFILSCWIVRHVCGLLVWGIFSFRLVLISFTFLSSFACFFCCPSYIIFNPGFVFLFRFLWRIFIIPD